jgi:hypothetical protein
MSIISLDGQIFAEIKIDDLDLPSGLPNFLEEMSIIENVAGVPVLTMTVNDSEGIISENIPLTDSNKISVVLATDLNELEENKYMDFRLFNWKGIQHQKGFRYSLNAIYDNHKFITEVLSKSYTGSSDYVLQQLAEHCGLDFVGSDSCIDSQTWLNFSDTLSTFARKVCQHSFIQNGCMSTTITAQGDLIYKDIIKAINGEEDSVFDSSMSDEDTFLIQEFSPSSSAGFMNAWLNYGYISVEDFLTGENQVYDAVTLTSTSGGSAVINQDITDSIKAVRRDYIIQDCGNTHSKYWKTYHNNLRILGLFSQRVVFLVDKMTNLSPLDVVKLNIINPNTGKPTTYSGKYIIGAKKTMIKGTKYAEIFEVYRNTVPNAGNSRLSSAEPSGGVKQINPAGNLPPEPTVIVVSK